MNFGGKLKSIETIPIDTAAPLSELLAGHAGNAGCRLIVERASADDAGGADRVGDGTSINDGN